MHCPVAKDRPWLKSHPSYDCLLLGIQKAQVFNFIFISLNRCSAFYVSKLEDVDGLCHLVDDEDEQTVGHGMDREDIYYIKEVGNLINISIGEFGLQQRAPRKKTHRSYRKFYFNEFVTNLLHDNTESNKNLPPTSEKKWDHFF